MKKILIATALAGAIVGSFASVSFAAPLPAMIDSHAPANIITVDHRCGPFHHYVRGFRARDGRVIPGHCVRDHR
ncbi:MAG TPA: hypothetical protein VGL83_06440 [Stellaceae bacterium]|jgi:hypothetical protein